MVASIGISRFKRRCDLFEKPALKLLFYFFGQLNWRPKNTKSLLAVGAQNLPNIISTKTSFRHLIADEILLILFHWKVHVLRPSSFLKRRFSRPFIFLPGHLRGA